MMAVANYLVIILAVTCASHFLSFTTCHVMPIGDVTNRSVSLAQTPVRTPATSKTHFRITSDHVIAIVGHRTVTYVERVSRGNRTAPLTANVTAADVGDVGGDDDVIDTCALLTASDESVFLVTSPTEPVCTTDDWTDMKNASKLRFAHARIT